MLIPIAPFPPPSVHPTILPATYSAWSSALGLHLQLAPAKFTSQSLRDEELCAFLLSYLRNQPNNRSEEVEEYKTLRRKVIILLHRIITLPEYANLPSDFTSGQFLRDAAASFPRSKVLKGVFDEERVWRRFEDGVGKLKRVVVAGKGVSQGEGGLEGLFRFSRRAAEMFLAGDDWLDVVVEKGVVGEFKVALLEVAGAGTLGVEGARKGNWSMVTDIIYGLINASENPKASGIAREKSFLKTLIESTMLISALRKCAQDTIEEGRVEDMLKALEKFGRPRVLRKRVANKGKGKGKEIMVGLSEEEEMEMMRKVATVRELLPDFGSGFVRRCLEALGGDVELATSALLENDLPVALKDVDTSEEYIPPDSSLATPILSHKATSSITRLSTLSTRRTIFDNDELSRLSPSALSRLHIGRKNASLSADTLLTRDRSSKASILSALAAFDSDDDERDDTYDLADVGGAVDTAGPGDEDPQRRMAPRTIAAVEEEDGGEDVAEKILYDAYKVSSDVFSRSAETRRGAARKTLKERTGWSDETIEGWKVMLDREPKRLRMLERRFSDLPGSGGGGGGGQNALERTKWMPTENGDSDGTGRGRGRGRGRGMGRARGGGGGGGGARGRGGNVAGPSGERETQQGRAKKEANKGSSANHNRRDQRAKKMARGGFPPAG